MDRNIPRGQLPTPEPPSLSARRAWIEMVVASVAGYYICKSLSARRAWIEIVRFSASLILPLVALRKESVDRNFNAVQIVVVVVVALRKESVDRNIPRGQLPTPEPPSLSARRAWIEMNSKRQKHKPTAGRSPQGERG